MSCRLTIILCFLFSVLIPQVVYSKGDLKTLGEDNWSEMLRGEWMVEFYAPWCPACQQLGPLWKDYAQWSDDLGIKVGQCDVTLNPGLSGRFMITALPTIYHIKDGSFRQYRGPRDKDSFISFVEEKKWQTIDPVSSWKSPNSFQMSAVSAFFKLSMLLRNVHNSLVQDYGVPYWGSYIIFGLITVFIGAILGLLVVCIIDFLFPSKTYQRLPLSPSDESQRDTKHDAEEEFEGDDVIKDDIPGDAELRHRREASSNPSSDL